MKSCSIYSLGKSLSQLFDSTVNPPLNTESTNSVKALAAKVLGVNTTLTDKSSPLKKQSTIGGINEGEKLTKVDFSSQRPAYDPDSPWRFSINASITRPKDFQTLSGERLEIIKAITYSALVNGRIRDVAERIAWMDIDSNNECIADCEVEYVQ